MADSYNELFGLGSHSADGSLELWAPCLDDAASTTVVDEGPNGHDGTLVGGDDTEDRTAAGPNNWLTASLLMDDTYHINFGDETDFEPTSTVTMLGRFYPTSAPQPNFATAFAKEYSSPRASPWASYKIAAHTSSWRAEAGTTSGAKVATASTGVSASTWFRMGATYNGTQAEVFVNGSPEATGGSGSSNLSYSNGRLLSGANEDDNEDFRGRVCDLCVFSRVLTDDEISEWDDGPELVNSVAPAISGTQTVGETLSCTTGTWVLDSPFASGSNGTATYSYQWTRSDDSGGTGETDISGETSSTYVLQSEDEAKYIRCRVRATNDGGYDSSADTNSNMSGAIAKGPLTYEETVTGSNDGGSVTSVTSGTVQGGHEQAYVVFVAVRNADGITSVSDSGGYLTWTKRKEQCGGRSQSSIACFTAEGSPGGSFTVTATVASTDTACIAVVRYSGADPSDAFEDETHGENTNGEDGACSGGTDDDSPTFTLDSTVDGSAHLVAVHTRTRSIDTEDGDYTDRGSVSAGTLGNTVTLYVRENVEATAGSDLFDPTLDNTSDWCCVGAVVRPVVAASTVGVGLSSITEYALAVSGGKTRSAGGVSSDEWSLPVIAALSKQGGVASETGGALSVSGAKTQATAFATSHESSLPVVAGQLHAILFGGELDSALSVGANKLPGFGFVLSEESALALERLKTTIAGVASGDESALPVVAVNRLTIAAEADLSLPVRLQGELFVPVDLCVEVDSALPLTAVVFLRSHVPVPRSPRTRPSVVRRPLFVPHTIGASFRHRLRPGELLSGVPRLRVSPSSGLGQSSPVVNSAEFVDHASRYPASAQGTSVLFRIAPTRPGTYYVRVDCNTNIPGEIVGDTIRIEVC